MYIGWKNEIDPASIVTSLPANNNYPISNIYHPLLQKKFQANSSGACKITARSLNVVSDIYVGNFNKSESIHIKVTDLNSGNILTDQDYDLALLFTYDLYYKTDTVDFERQICIHLDDEYIVEVEITITPIDSNEPVFCGLLWLGTLNKFGETLIDSQTEFRDYSKWVETQNGLYVPKANKMYEDKTFKIFALSENLVNLYRILGRNRLTYIVFSGTNDTLTDMRFDSLCYGMIKSLPPVNKKKYTQGDLTIITQLYYN